MNNTTAKRAEVRLLYIFISPGLKLVISK